MAGRNDYAIISNAKPKDPDNKIEVRYPEHLGFPSKHARNRVKDCGGRWNSERKTWTIYAKFLAYAEQAGWKKV